MRGSVIGAPMGERQWGSCPTFLAHDLNTTRDLNMHVYAIAAAVPLQPEDITVPVTIVSSCVIDCNFNIVKCPCNGPVCEVSP